ncbi:MAG: hypothetical protein Q4G45_10275 [Actinomycetia bacterium]|nr:hypothetical protein [Actinomycetes bacterium]
MPSLDQQIAQARPSDHEIAAEFSPERQQAVLDRVLLRVAAPAPAAASRTRRWLLGAGVAVALGLGSAAVVGAEVLGRFEPAPPANPPQPAPTLTSASSFSQPASSTGSLAGRDGVALLPEIAANAAAKSPLVVGPTQYLHEVSVEVQTGQDPSERHHDTYISADGWAWRKSEESGQTRWHLGKPDTGLASLPADPARLDAALRRQSGTNSADERVFKGIHDMLTTHQTTPAQRKAAIAVLENLARHPQQPARTKDGELASPRVGVTQARLDNGESGVRAAIVDPTSRPGVEFYLVLTMDGSIASSGSTSPEGTYTSTVTTLEVVDALPPDFVANLGTAKPRPSR